MLREKEFAEITSMWHLCALFKLLFQNALSKILTEMNSPLLWKCLIPLTKPDVPVKRVKWKPSEQLPTRLFFSLFGKLLFGIKWFFRFKRLSRNTKIEASFHCQNFEKQTFHLKHEFFLKVKLNLVFPAVQSIIVMLQSKNLRKFFFFSPSS